MTLQQQYVSDVGIDNSTYKNDAERRIAEIYQTSRKGQIKKSLAKAIWNVLQPAYEYAVNKKMPPTQKEYDKFVVNYALKLQAILCESDRGGFGIGQKIVNLFMKDLWGLGIVGMPTESLLHAPLDRIILGKLSKVPASWKSWTGVIATNRMAPEIADYLRIQQSFRHYRIAGPVRFRSVIGMEQFMWHRIKCTLTRDERNKSMKILIQLADRRGHLTYDDINRTLPASEYSDDMIEPFLASLRGMDIEIKP